ncbi:MAG: HNH endonuclease [Ruminococcus sp.]|nr:HNH endonuclease [Ruminococcus sp.]
MKTIPLTRGKSAVVDDEDYTELIKFRWFCVPSRSHKDTWYAVRRGQHGKGEPSTVWMHREIMHSLPGEIVDHINSNGLDNRKENLRHVTTLQNSFNQRKMDRPCSSRFKGVSSRRGRWRARIKYHECYIELGMFDDEMTAAAVYNFASRLFFGQYRHENDGARELTHKEQKRIFDLAQRHVERYGWYVDTETYRSFYFKNAS